VRLRVFLLALLGFLLLGLAAAAWLLPARIDWAERRAEVEGAAAAVLGRPVLLREEFGLRLLPSPVVSARGLTVVDVGDGFAVEAAEVRLALRFWPLLRGRVVATDIVLVRPRIALSGITPPAFPASLAPAWIAQADVRIEDGTLSLAGFEARAITARVSGEGTGGPFALDGEATALGRRFSVTARLDRADALGTARLELALATLAGPRIEADAVGLVALPTLTFAGRARLALDDLSHLLPAPPLPTVIEFAQLTASPAGLEADDVRLTLAPPPGAARPPAVAAGALRFRPQPAQLSLTLRFALLDLDPWIAPLSGAVGTGGLPVALDLQVASASLAGGTLRDLRLVARIEEQQVAIDEAAALLPGAASASLSGAARRTDAGLRFEGLASLDAADLRGTLGWGGWSADWAAPGRLRSARGSAQVMLAAGLLQLAGLDAVVDGVRLAGGLVLNTQAARPSFGAGLTIEALEPEAWLAPSLRAPSALAARLAGIDANLRLETPLLRLAGITARGVGLDATLDAGRLAVRRLAASDLGGARLTLAGAGTLGQQPHIADLRAELETSDAAPLLALLPDTLAFPELLAGPALLRLSGQAAAGAPLAVEAEAELAGARAELRGTLDLAEPRFAGGIALRHPGAPRLLRALGQAGLADWVADGSFSLLGQAELSPRRVALAQADLVAGQVRAGGELALGLDGAPSIAGRLAIETLALPWPAADWPPLPLAALRAGRLDLGIAIRALALGPVAIQAVEASLLLADGRLAMPRFSGQLAGGALAAQASLDATPPTPAAAATISLRDATLAGPLSGQALDLAAGQVELSASLAARGFGFAALLATLSGEARLSVTQGVLGGFDLAAAGAALREPRAQQDALAALRAALSGGASAFDRLDAEVRIEAGSLLVEAATMATEAGAARLAGVLDLARAGIDVQAVLQPAGAEALPEVGVRMTGSAAAPRRVFDTAAAARWLADQPAR
jgi:hypothetical protein